MIESERFLHHESDIWMVQGDTSTAFCHSKQWLFIVGLRIAHVEAGLRTFNMYSPFPEEFNRKNNFFYCDVFISPQHKRIKITY